MKRKIGKSTAEYQSELRAFKICKKIKKDLLP